MKTKRMRTKEMWAAALVYEIMRRSATDNSDRPVPKKEAVEHLGIGVDYAEQLMVPLRKAGILRSRKGLGGGFFVAKTNVTLLDVVKALRDEPYKTAGIPARLTKAFRRVDSIWDVAASKERIADMLPEHL